MSERKCLIYLRRTGKHQRALRDAITNTLRTVVDDLEVVSFNKRPFADFVKTQHFEFSNWDEARQQIREFISHYDTFFITFFQLNTFDIDKAVEKTKTNIYYSMTYVSQRDTMLYRIIYDEIIAANKKVKCLLIDPQEKVEYNKLFYILNHENLTYFPFYEYGLYQICNKYDLPKTQNFTFFATAVSKCRQYLLDNKETIENLGGKIILNKYDGSISQYKYYELLSQSLYTLIIPSYDISTFSIIRFLEAIFCKCIPFIWSEVNLHDLEFTFNDVYNIIIKYKDFLIINNFNEIKEKSKNIELHQKILDEIRNTNTYKLITNKDEIKKFYNTIFY